MRAHSSGFTLLELVAAIAVLAILLAVGLPSYQSMRQDNVLGGAVRALYSDIHLARSEAVKRNVDTIGIKFFTGSNWCYRLTDNAGCTSCTATCDINGDGINRGGDVTLFPGTSLSITGSYSGDRLSIGARRASMLSGSATFTLAGKQTQVVTSALGRVRFCALSGTSVAGIPAC